MKNSLLPKNALRTELSNGNKKILIFKCRIEGCNREIRVPPAKIHKYTGKCASCVLKKRPFGVAYNRLLSNCEKKNVTNSITYAQFLEFTKIKICIYCGSEIEWSEFTTSENGSVAYNLDRKENSRGYSKDNCVVCCKICNWAKNDLFSHEEFLQIGKSIGRVLRNRK